ncbi:MAG: DUF945 family protein [Desulfobacterium sp.]|nr:DUF945 family protein [Desulfobacterium sp.]
MKKMGIALVFIILIAGVGSPIFSGIMMERVVNNSVEEINEMYAETGSDIALEIIRYDRSLFSSEIEWRINLGSMTTFYSTKDLVLVDRADHGFLGVTSKTSLENNRWFTDWVEDKLSGDNPLEIETRYKVLGNITTTLTLKAFSITEDDDVINILPAQMAFETGMDLQNIAVHGRWDGLSVPEKLNIDGIAIESKLDKISTYIWQGDTSISVNQATVTDKRNPVAFSDFKCTYNMDYDKAENAVSLGMEYGIAGIKTQEDELLDGFVRLGINRIDAQGYEAFMKLYSTEMNNIMKTIAGSQQTPDEMNEMMEAEMLRIGPRLIGPAEKLLKKGLEIEITGLKAQLPQGKIKGDLSLSLKQDMTMAQFIPIAMQPGAALDILSLKSAITLPSELTGDNPQLLAPVYPGMQTGLFIKQGDNLVHRAETRDGKLFINEKEFLFN